MHYIYSSDIYVGGKVKDMIENQQGRKSLKIKMSHALKEELSILPVQMQTILVDDLITAFESRIAVLSRAKSNVDFAVEVGLEVLQ